MLVVDDSAYIRKVVKEMLSRSPSLEVVGTARDSEEALELVERLKPDVVTCDLIMPGADGVDFIQRQMSRRRLPIVIVSMAGESSERVLSGLDAGAIDFVQKPTALATERVFDVADELIAKVTAAAGASMRELPQAQPRRDAVATSTFRNRYSVLVVGVSTGGPQGLKSVIARLPADFPIPVAVVLHMPIGYTEAYAKRLDELSALTVDGSARRRRVSSRCRARRARRPSPEASARSRRTRHLAARRQAPRYAASSVGGRIVPIRRRRLRRRACWAS